MGPEYKTSAAQVGNPLGRLSRKALRRPLGPLSRQPLGGPSAL